MLLQAWRHRDLRIRMFSPMLVYQTFADTTLQDVDSRDAVAKYVKRSLLYKKMEAALADPYTQQPLQHVLDEPIMQLGPGGLVVTVERHLKWMGWGILLSTTLQGLGYKVLVRIIVTSTVGLFATIKGIVWILMHWK